MIPLRTGISCICIRSTPPKNNKNRSQLNPEPAPDFVFILFHKLEFEDAIFYIIILAHRDATRNPVRSAINAAGRA